MMKKAVFIVFLGIVGLSAIFAQAFPVDDSNGDIYTKKDNFGIKQEDAVNVNHINSPYFTMPDVFEMKLYGLMNFTLLLGVNVAIIIPLPYGFFVCKVD